MREIKFRGIYVDTNEFVYGWFSKLKTGDQSIIFDPTGIGTFYVVRPETVGQYVGLKDNTKWEDLTEKERGEWLQMSRKVPNEWKGREIFEGDVCQAIIPGSCSCKDLKEKGVIEMYALEWCFDVGPFYPLSRDGWLESLNKVRKDIKIIGSIHKNPELLK